VSDIIHAYGIGVKEGYARAWGCARTFASNECGEYAVLTIDWLCK